MSDKIVTLTTRVETCDGVTKKYIEADPWAVVLKNKNFMVQFDNKLDDQARIKFFEITDKGDLSAVKIDFCNNNPGDTLLVNTTGVKNCKHNEDGNFAYTVEADGYQKLDPVVIIEPLAVSPSLLSLLPSVLFGAAVGGVAVFGVQRFLAHRKIKKEAA